MGTNAITVDDLRRDAQTWLAAHRHEAPRDYGAILPPELVDAGRAWQRSVHHGDARWGRLGGEGPVAASLAKLGVTELVFDAAVLEGDLAGPDAMLAGDAADRLLGAPGGRIAGGTTQVQKNIIGERLLGLPR